MSTTDSDSPMIQLRYFAGRGLMEVPRMILAAGGKFPPVIPFPHLLSPFSSSPLE
jgi:hypothetical protein